MPRGQEKSIVGGQIDPYLQQSMQQNKQLAENRLTTAMQEKGATQRTAMQEKGAGERASLQAQTQREGQAAQSASDDKRAAEAEIARREDRKFAQTMQETTQEFQAKQSELDRDQQKAIISGDRKYKDEIEKRREALRRFNIEMSMDASERDTNAMLSIIKGVLNESPRWKKPKRCCRMSPINLIKIKRYIIQQETKWQRRLILIREWIYLFEGSLQQRLSLLDHQWDLAVDLHE